METPHDDQDHIDATAYALDQEDAPEARKARKAAALDILRKLRDIEKRAEAGEPVYAEMAARIEARRIEDAEALVREALDGETL